jgi:WD40 repeat protein
VDRDRQVNCLAFSPDGELVAVGGEDGCVRAWRVDKGERLLGGDLPVHQKAVADLVFTPDKKLLITGATDGEVRVWELATIKPGQAPEPAHTFKAHAARIVAFAMSPDGSRFVSVGADDEVRLWETATAKELRRWALRVPVRNVAFAVGGKQVATANADGTAYLLEVP